MEGAIVGLSSASTAELMETCSMRLTLGHRRDWIVDPRETALLNRLDHDGVHRVTAARDRSGNAEVQAAALRRHARSRFTRRTTFASLCAADVPSSTIGLGQSRRRRIKAAWRRVPVFSKMRRR